jgi:hypothetical protein
MITGAQKSASTSVAKWFGEHNGVVQLGTECIAFEGRVHRLRTRRVQSQVTRLAAKGVLCVLKRPEILHNEYIRSRAAAAFPEAVAVAVLRDPVDRAASAWDHYRRAGVIDANIRLRDCVTEWKKTGDNSPAGQVVGFSLYSVATMELKLAFQRTNIVFHDDVLRDPSQAFRDVFDQLELAQEPGRALPLMNSREQGVRVSPLPRLSGRWAYRWDDDEHHLSPRSLGYRVVAVSRMVTLAAGRTAAEAQVKVTEEDRSAIREITCPDLDVLEERLGCPLPSSWVRS